MFPTTRALLLQTLGSLLLLTLALAVAGPAAARSDAPALRGKDKLVLKGVGRQSEIVPLSLGIGDDGRFTFHRPDETWSGATAGKARRPELRVDFSSIPEMEAALEADVVALLSENGFGESTEDRERQLKRLIGNLREGRLELEALALERDAIRRRIEEDGSKEIFLELEGRLREIEGLIRTQQEQLAKLESMIEDFDRSAGAPSVRVRVTDVDLRARFNRRRTRVDVTGKVRFDVEIEGESRRYRGIRKIDARGPVFE